MRRARLQTGTIVDRYELVCPIGDGGMAEVWVARQKGKYGFEKLFALKCIHERFAAESAFRSMFLDEARIASGIGHPNVAQVFDLGESEAMLYLVMEYVDGESLGALLASGRSDGPKNDPVPVPVAVRIIADVCAGLDAAHKIRDDSGQLRGVVHRDISPHNIVISASGDVKVIDFGIAHARDRYSGDTDLNSALKGKLRYMAPEQALRQDVSPATDVFAAGATLYRMLAGRPPFDGGNDAATLHLLLGDLPPEALPEAVPPALRAVVERALARRPDNRFPSARAMHEALETVMPSDGLAADVAFWVNAHLSESAKSRRTILASRKRSPGLSVAPPSFEAELNPSHARPRASVVDFSPGLPKVPREIELEPNETVSPRFEEPRLEKSSGHASPSGVQNADPGMMDVRALVAQHRKGEPLRAPGPVSEAAPKRAVPVAPPPSPNTTKIPVQGTREAPLRVRTGHETKSLAEGVRGSTKPWVKSAVGLIFVLIALAGMLLALPTLLRARIVDAARDVGVEVTIDRVSLGMTGLHARGVTATAPRLPGAQARVDDLFFVGPWGREVRVRGLLATLHGAGSEVGPAWLAFYEQHRARLEATTGTPRTILLIDSRLTWEGAFGEATHLEVGDLGAEFESHGTDGEEVRASAGRLEVTTPRTVLGPWAGTFDRSGTTSRVRLLFDPPVPDGPSLLLLFGDAPTRLTLKIARSKLERLGFHLKEGSTSLGPDTELEMSLEGSQRPNERLEGAGRLDLFGARVRGLKSAVDVTLQGSASGRAGKPLELEKTTLSAGPFLANVSGSITPTDAGFRVDASWRTLPIACEKLARAEAKALGPVALAVEDLARATGALRVTGTANASGLARYDSKTLDDASLTYVTRETCGLSLFGM